MAIFSKSGIVLSSSLLLELAKSCDRNYIVGVYSVGRAATVSL